MSLVNALTLADAQLLVLVSMALVGHPEHTSRIITRLIAVSNCAGLSFTATSNVLRLLLSYTSPIAVSPDEISELASVLVHTASNNELSENALIEDIENLASWLANEFQVSLDVPEDAILQTAKDLLVSLVTDAHMLSFDIDEDNADPESTLFAFARAKCLQLGSYFVNVTDVAESFLCLRNYEPFRSWIYGIILPYDYYHQNYAVLSDIAKPEVEYLSLETYADRFEFLIAPLNSRKESLVSKLLPRAYFSSVLLPLAVYHLDNLNPISEWAFQQNSGCDNVAEFELWDEILRTVLSFHNHNGDRFTAAHYEQLVRHYVYACLFFGLYKSDRMLSSAQARTQAQIRDTLLYLVEMLGKADCATQVASTQLDLPEYSSLEAFVETPPKFLKHILESSLEGCINLALQVFSTCCSLHPLNDLTVSKFFLLKSHADSNSQWFHKEVMQIFSRTGTQSYDQILQALSVFSDSFLSQNAETVRELDQLVFENLLQVGNFPKAFKYLNDLPDNRRLSTETAFQLVSRKFWELFENASNLDDRIGKLKLATDCLDILDTISNEGGLSEENQANVVKIKHLLKAIRSLKNFKLVLVRNQPVTPKQILDKVTASSSEDKYPQFAIISMVLEQNPKSYFAHERLHKIVNDLAIYANLDLSVMSFSRIQSACVESALVDGNFDFAFKQTKALISYYVKTGNTQNFSDIWLMFFQVGKYILLDWFGDYDAKVQEEKISVLVKQREILSLAVKYTKPNAFSTDNSRLLVGQFKHVNQEIKKWYEEADLHRSEEIQDAFQSTQQQIQENLTGLFNEASHSKNQASEKISNLFMSGLGWAIGVKR